LTFEVGPGHPLRTEVLGMLRKVRTDVNELWARVASYNDERADELEGTEPVRVTFYFGQNASWAPGKLAAANVIDDGCVTDRDCTEVPLDTACSRACSSGPVSRTRRESLLAPRNDPVSARGTAAACETGSGSSRDFR